MQDLENLVEVLKNIKKHATKIGLKLVDVMEEVNDISSDAVSEVVAVTECENSVAQTVLQDLTIAFVDDAQKVLNEIDEFANASHTGAVSHTSTTYPFLAEVWYGDVYDDDGIKGLECLNKDLSDKLSNAKASYFIAQAIKQLTK
jgi:CHASE3 domain sensor protein